MARARGVTRSPNKNGQKYQFVMPALVAGIHVLMRFMIEKH
jgi:hypothetical protein